jgi:hypothetical protein
MYNMIIKYFTKNRASNEWGDVNALFPLNHDEKSLCLEDVEQLRRVGSQS